MTKKAVSSFKYSRSCSGWNGALLEAAKVRVQERLKTYGTLKIMLNVRSLSVRVKREKDENVEGPMGV